MSKQKSLNWEALRTEFEKSELSIAAFAKLKGFSRSTGHKHLADIAAEKQVTFSGKSEEANDEAEKAEFIPLELTEPDFNDIEVPEVTFIKTPVIKVEEPTDIPIEIKMDQLTLLLHTGFNKDNLRSVLEVLRESC